MPANKQPTQKRPNPNQEKEKAPTKKLKAEGVNSNSNLAPAQKINIKPGYVVNIPMHVGVDSDISSSSESSNSESEEFSETELENPPYEIDQTSRGKIIKNKIYTPNTTGKRSHKKRIDTLANIIATEAFGTTETSIGQSKERIHINIGMNRMHSISKQRNKALKRALNEEPATSLSTQRFGFFWQPKWKRIDSEGEETLVELTEVKRFYKSLKKWDPKKAKQFLEINEGELTKDKTIKINFNRMVPYREIRELIKNNPHTSDLVKELRKKLPHSEIYLVIMDKDTKQLKVEQQGVFGHYDQLITTHRANNNGISPHILSSGYTVPDDHPMIRLAVTIDFAVRQAMAAVFPLAPYYPEPNLLILINNDETTVKEKFVTSNRYSNYDAPQESIILINHLLQQRKLDSNKAMVFDATVPLTTTIPYRFHFSNKILEENEVRKTYVGYYSSSDFDYYMDNKVLCWTEADLTALINTSQSHAKFKLWYDKVYSCLKLESSKINVTIAAKQYEISGKQRGSLVRSLLSRLYASFNPITIAKYRVQNETLTEPAYPNNLFITQLSYVINHYEQCAPTVIQKKKKVDRHFLLDVWQQIEAATSIDELEKFLKILLPDVDDVHKLIQVAKNSGFAIKNSLEQHLCLDYTKLTEIAAHNYFKSIDYIAKSDNINSKLLQLQAVFSQAQKEMVLQCQTWLEEIFANNAYPNIISFLKQLYIIIEPYLITINELTATKYIKLKQRYFERFDLLNDSFDIDLQYFTQAFKEVIVSQLIYLKSEFSEYLKLDDSNSQNQLENITQFFKNFDENDIRIKIRSCIKKIFKSLPIIQSLNPINTAIVNNTILKNKELDLNKVQPDMYGTTPMHWAAITGNKSAIKWLLEKNIGKEPQAYADIAKAADNGVLPLHCALHFCKTFACEDTELIGLLCDSTIINAKTITNRSPLLIAMAESNTLIAYCLCLLGALPSSLHNSIAQILRRANKTELATPILAACHYLKDDPLLGELIEKLVEQGADPNEPGWLENLSHSPIETFPILIALANENVPAVNSLLKQELKLTKIYNAELMPPLFIAYKKESELFLRKKSDPDHNIEKLDLLLLKKLLDAGANINEAEKMDDNTLLHEAILADDIDLLHFLLNYAKFALSNFSEDEIVRLKTCAKATTVISNNLEDELLQKIKLIDLTNGNWRAMKFEQNEVECLKKFLVEKQEKDLSKKLPQCLKVDKMNGESKTPLQLAIEYENKPAIVAIQEVDSYSSDLDEYERKKLDEILNDTDYSEISSDSEAQNENSTSNQEDEESPSDENHDFYMHP